MEGKVNLSREDIIIRNVEKIIRKIREDQRVLYTLKSDPTAYKDVIRELRSFIRNTEKEAKINIRKYQHVIRRREVLHKVRKRFSDIFKPIINLLEDEQNIDDDNIDYFFINSRIDRFVQEIRGLSNKNFTIYMNT